MPRRPRVEVEGGVYHVYNRTASGEPVFSDQSVALDFVERVRSVKKRDGWTIFAWCLMTNHYHLALRTSSVPLSESLHWLQGRFSREFNKHRDRSGGLWHSRYHAKLIDEQRYLSQLVLYIHLNPVRAGVVKDPAKYGFSGHREIVRPASSRLTDVDQALLCFADARRAARHAYLAGIRAGVAEHTKSSRKAADGRGADWWALIPRKDHDLEPQASKVQRHGIDRRGMSRSVDELMVAACQLLGVTLERLSGPARDRAVARDRRLIASVLSERWGVPRKSLATALRRNPEVVSHWVSEARAKHSKDASFAHRCDELDAKLADRYATGDSP
jgi:REP element-mobilizing transposase RayT